ncbi:MAG: FecR domain-containing protein [Gallionellaceae bacterium]
MRYIAVVVLSAILGFANIASAQDEHVALFKNISGSVQVIRNQSEIIPVPGTQLMRLDRVVTGANSSAGITFKDGTLLTVGASADIEISRYVFQPKEGKYDFSVYMKKGSAVYSSGKLGKLAPEAVNFNTPRATVGVRGTRFIINAD